MSTILPENATSFWRDLVDQLSPQQIERLERDPNPVHRNQVLQCAVGTAMSNDEEIRANVVWMLREILHKVAPDELTTAELVSMVVILIPAHSRLLDAAVPKAAVLPFKPREKKRNVST